jgi:hypothetical protein
MDWGDLTRFARTPVGNLYDNYDVQGATIATNMFQPLLSRIDMSNAFNSGTTMTPNPFVAAAQSAQQNSRREFHNLADSASVPQSKTAYNAGGSRSLMQAIMHGTAGDIASKDFQTLISSLEESASKSRRALDAKHHQDLRAADVFTRLLGDASPEDADALANASLIEKMLNDKAAAWDKENPLAADPRAIHQAELNSKGIREYGSPPDGNYMKLDSWQAIDHDRKAQREAALQQTRANLAAGLLSHLGAVQSAKEQEALQMVSAVAAAQQQRQKANLLLQAMPEQLKAELAKSQAETGHLNAVSQYNRAQAQAVNPSLPKHQMTTALLKYLAQNPEAAAELDLSGVFHAAGARELPSDDRSWVDKVMGKPRPRNAIQQPPEAGEALADEDMPTPPKPNTPINEDAFKVLWQKHGGDRNKTRAAAQQLGWKVK